VELRYVVQTPSPCSRFKRNLNLNHKHHLRGNGDGDLGQDHHLQEDGGRKNAGGKDEGGDRYKKQGMVTIYLIVV
tara:strand:- start:72 stop:296 length:225 start_codon:yes stop_codon:yes gene_type:complete